MSPDGQFVDVIYVSGSDFTRPFGINNAGDIAGTYYANGHFHGFVRIGRVITTVDVPGAEHTCATGINDDGAIVGYFYPTPEIEHHGFIAVPR